MPPRSTPRALEEHVSDHARRIRKLESRLIAPLGSEPTAPLTFPMAVFRVNAPQAILAAGLTSVVWQVTDLPNDYLGVGTSQIRTPYEGVHLFNAAPFTDGNAEMDIVLRINTVQLARVKGAGAAGVGQGYGLGFAYPLAANDLIEVYVQPGANANLTVESYLTIVALV